MPIAKNPETGETFELRGGRWVPVQGNQFTEVAGQQSAVDALAISAGRQLTQYGRGGQNLAASALGLALPGEAAAIKGELSAKDASERAAFAELQRQRPISTFVGGLAPDIATLPLGGGAIKAGARGAASIIGEQSALGAAQGGLSYNPNVSDQFLGALLGGATTAFGGGAGEALGRVRGMFRQPQTTVERLTGQLQPGPLNGRFTSDTMEQLQARATQTGQSVEQILTGNTPLPGSAEYSRLLSRGEDMGFIFSAGERTRSGPIRQLEAARASNPLTSGLDLARKENNSGQLNRLALGAIGEEVPAGARAVEFRESSLGAANNRLADEFEAVAGDASIRLDQELFDELHRISNASQSTSIKATGVPDVVERFVELTGENLEINGARLLSERSDLVGAIRRLERSDQAGAGPTARRLREIVDAVDAAVTRQLPDELAQRYARARGQFRMLTTLDRPGMIANGKVQGGKFAAALRRDYPAEFRRGDQFGTVQVGDQATADLFDAARITSEFKDIVGDSGTTTRSSLMNFLRDPARGLVANAGGAAIDLALQRGVLPLTQRAASAAGRATSTPAGVGGALGRVLGVPTETDLLLPALQP